MSVKLTDEQLAAVKASVSENLVSAAAGSGKTKVLSERIVSRIKSGDTSIDRLLIVTFTRAAAIQMKEKIAEAIEKEYKKNNQHSIRRQLSMIAGADICTIDSFCINLVKRNFFRVDVPPDFTVADSNEMKILREEVLIETLDRMYQSQDKNFLLLAETVGSGKNDNALKEMILKAYIFTRAFEEPDEWLDYALLNHKAGSDGNCKLYEFIKKEIEDRINELGEIICHAQREAEDAQIESYLEVMNRESERFNLYLANSVVDENFEDRLNSFYFDSFPGGRRKVEEGFENEKNFIRSLHSEAKDLFDEIQKLYGVYCDERGVSYHKVEALVKCVRLFSDIYMEEKLAKKVLEFSDCEYLALKVLKNSSEVCDELRDKYDEIYIDEYQDTNPLQDALFTLLSRKERGEPNVFIVGDIKQSIYRFRHSDPGVFAKKARTFGKDENSRKMILSKNFRSRGEVLDSVNCVFERIMRENTAGVEYNDEHKLRCGAKYIEYNQNKSELYILKNKYDGDEEELLASEQAETLVVAERIKKMMNEGFLVSDEGRMRPLRYSDIAVLSPKITGRADMITGMFALMGIPAFCETAQNFFDAMEIQTIIALLKCVDNPLCDIPLASLMRSPIFAFSENELTCIRADGRDKPFYNNVAETAKLKNKLGRKCKKFLESISQWREKALVTSLERFVTYVIDESGYYSFVGALPGGSIRQANLRRLMLLAATYEKNQYKGLYNFVRYIDKAIENKGEVENEVSHSDDSVLVTSIHKSKGLEFPVVFVIGCGSKFNDQDSTSNLVMNPVGGMAIAEREADRKVKFKTAEYTAVSSMIMRENHAEQMRLLYVAMTRAKEKLIMIGSTKDVLAAYSNIDMCSLGKLMSDYKIRTIKNYLDYLCNSISGEYWDVHFVDELPEIIADEECVSDKPEYKTIEEVVYRLSYLYPYDGIRNIPSKMSVSEIKKMSMDSEESVSFYKSAPQRRIPAFVKENEKLIGSSRGTAYHRVMELISLDETDVKGALERFANDGFMDQRQLECIDIEKIEKFLASSIAERMRRAKRLWREESFTISIDAQDIFEEGENEKICVQGTIDCLFEEDDGKIILLDYKTDAYDDPNDIAKRYKKQLELYEVAIFKRFGQKCNKKCLYLFEKGDIIDV